MPPRHDKTGRTTSDMACATRGPRLHTAQQTAYESFFSLERPYPCRVQAQTIFKLLSHTNCYNPSIFLPDWTLSFARQDSAHKRKNGFFSLFILSPLFMLRHAHLLSDLPMLERRSLPPTPLLLAADFLLDFLAALVWRTELVLEIPLPLHWWFPLPTHLRVESGQKRFLMKSLSPPFSIQSPVPSRAKSPRLPHSLLHILYSSFNAASLPSPIIWRWRTTPPPHGFWVGGIEGAPASDFPCSPPRTGSSLRPHSKFLSPTPREKAMSGVSLQELAT